MSDSQNIRKRGPEPTIRRAAKTWLGNRQHRTIHFGDSARQ